MTTSGTWNFAPNAGEVTLNALSRIGIRGPAILPEHLLQARYEFNFMQMEWNNKGPNRWTVDLQTINLVAGTSTYPVDATTVDVMEVYIETPEQGNDSVPIDRIITRISVNEYASYPDKTTPGFPTVYWYDRLVSPSITFWQPPDDTQTYVAKFYRFRRIQDAVLSGGVQPEINPLAYDAAAAGLAHRLSRHFAQNLEAQRKMDAKEAWDTFASMDTEKVDFYISPMTADLWR